ncbi:hypothetical protein [Clostridium sp. HBUAS56017]|uniref:hypothetical protein n=1 Tax=Clostridium sp. HBUAS56017 TaxID=2571128 RepID=UPI00163D5CBA|nr:hypothetical protein [Clostridium sp. HBUAS56017]
MEIHMIHCGIVSLIIVGKITIVKWEWSSSIVGVNKVSLINMDLLKTIYISQVLSNKE